MGRSAALARDLLKMLVVAAAYAAAAELSLRVALVERNVTPVWPPTGIALVVFLLFGPRMWPAIAAGAFLVNAPISPSLAAAALIAAGNTLAPLLSFFLLVRVGFRPELDRFRDAMAIIFLGALVGMLLSATVGSGALVLSGAVPAGDYAATWAVWWTGDAMGVLIFAPFLLGLRSLRHAALPSWPRRLEAAALFLVLAVVTYTVFRTRLQVQYVVFPLLGWAAWRFEQRGAATAALLASGTAVWAAVQGTGPFEEGQLFQRMVTLQVFNVGIAFTSFVFAAVVMERRRAGETLRRAALELEERIRERTSELSAANERLSREMGERKRAEEDLRTAGELLSQAEQIAHVGSWEWDIAVDRITCSDELFRIFGLQPAEFDGTYRSFLSFFHPEDRDFADRMVRRGLKERVGFQFDHRIVRPDGMEPILRARGDVVLDASGVPVRIVGTAQDITEQRRAEETLRRFIANASHELRTPLTAVSALAQLLATKRHQLSEELFEGFLEALGHQGERARRLIVDLLDLSRAEQGQILARPVPLALKEAVGRALRAAPPPQESSVEVDVPDDLGVLADPDILERAVINLLTNAYKYGGTNIRLRARAWKERAQIVVADDGPGIPRELVPHLFEPFSRGPVPSGTGTGLGLAIARSLVQSLAGEIHYEPGRPRGARFVLNLPLAIHGPLGDTSHPAVVAGTTEGAPGTSERDQSARE